MRSSLGHQVTGKLLGSTTQMERHKTAAFSESFRYSTSKCWNNIPPSIRNARSVAVFNLKLKRFLSVHQIGQGNLRHDTSVILGCYFFAKMRFGFVPDTIISYAIF